MAADTLTPAQHEPGDTRIEGGIEWYAFEEDGRIQEECQCARCGSSCGALACWDCNGEGGHHGEDIERSYDFGWIDPAGWYPCQTCRGKPYSQHCLSSPEWCEAHPLPGREHIESTALKPEAWH